MSDSLSPSLQEVTYRWRVTLIATAVVSLALLLLFHATLEGMVQIWYRYETYTHGFVILPITLWLIWQKRAHLAAYTPQPTSALFLLVVGCLATWAIARLVGVQVVEQFAMVSILIASVATLIGWQVAKFLAFPLLFLLFAVPMGEDLVPPMMEYTATFTVWALKLTGIPVYRDGLWFSLPSGNWSVVEACSGVRYLIASITLGVMYAYITYHTLWKRLLFIALSAIVPVIANGVRAYMIVMIGHLSKMEYAVGVDHLIYGWIFFGVVMFVLFWIGSYWQEEDEPPQFVAPPRLMTGSVVSTRVVALAASIFLAATLTVWVESWAADRVTTTVAELQAPEQVAGWTKVSEPTLWTAETLPTEHTIAARYRSGSDEVQLFVAFFPQQRQGVEAISNENELAEDLFRYARMGTVVATMGSEQVPVNQARAMVQAKGVLHEHLVWQWYRVAGHSLINRYAGKAREAIARLYPGRADGAWIAVTTPYDEEHRQASKQRLENFVKEVAPLLDIAIDSVLGYAE